MNPLGGLEGHPIFFDPWNYDDPEVQSFHEAACSVARHMASHPEFYGGLSPVTADLLNDINEAVALLAGQLMSDPQHPLRNQDLQ